MKLSKKSKYWLIGILSTILILSGTSFGGVYLYGITNIHVQKDNNYFVKLDNNQNNLSEAESNNLKNILKKNLTKTNDEVFFTYNGLGNINLILNLFTIYDATQSSILKEKYDFLQNKIGNSSLIGVSEYWEKIFFLSLKLASNKPLSKLDKEYFKNFIKKSTNKKTGLLKHDLKTLDQENNLDYDLGATNYIAKFFSYNKSSELSKKFKIDLEKIINEQKYANNDIAKEVQDYLHPFHITKSAKINGEINLTNENINDLKFVKEYLINNYKKSPNSQTKFLDLINFYNTTKNLESLTTPTTIEINFIKNHFLKLIEDHNPNELNLTKEEWSFNLSNKKFINSILYLKDLKVFDEGDIKFEDIENKYFAKWITIANLKNPYLSRRNLISTSNLLSLIEEFQLDFPISKTKLKNYLTNEISQIKSFENINVRFLKNLLIIENFINKNSEKKISTKFNIKEKYIQEISKSLKGLHSVSYALSLVEEHKVLNNNENFYIPRWIENSYTIEIKQNLKSINSNKNLIDIWALTVINRIKKLDEKIDTKYLKDAFKNYVKEIKIENLISKIDLETLYFIIKEIAAQDSNWHQFFNSLGLIDELKKHELVFGIFAYPLGNLDSTSLLYGLKIKKLFKWNN